MKSPGRQLSRWVDHLLDRSILFSFDKSGFARHSGEFREEDLEVDLTGRVCLVTGANSGLGRVVATELARRQATVWMLCRHPGRGRTACREISLESGNSQVHLATVDISDQGSVSEFVSSFPSPRVDVLVHNAGVLLAERGESVDGIESTLATHVTGPFLLTRLLVERLERSDDARVVWVSSGGMYGARLNVGDLQWLQRQFDGVRAYAEAKRAQVILSELFASRWIGRNISAYAMHPGWADTPGVRRSLPRFWQRLEDRLRTPAEGADTILWLSVCKRLLGRTGLFWFDRQAVPTHLVPWTRGSDKERRCLWKLCEELTHTEEREEKVA